jgi:hypothetical protein
LPSAAPKELRDAAKAGAVELTAVITGAISALTRKGSARHIRAGRWFYRAIAVVFATAIALAIMRWRQLAFLAIHVIAGAP